MIFVNLFRCQYDGVHGALRSSAPDTVGRGRILSRVRRPHAGLVAAAALGLALAVTPRAHAVSSRTLFTLTGSAGGDQLGISVAPAGDVNGDGHDDFVVGAPGNDAGGADAGRAYVFLGGPALDATPDLTLTGAAPGDAFGWSVAGAGDLNGDGYDDVVVGASRNDAGGADAGRAYVYHGGPVPNATPDLILTGAAAGDNFGGCVASAGDINGDGYSDLVIGAFRHDTGGVDTGRAYVYLGGPAADAVPDVTLTGAAAGDGFGVSVAAAGDVDGDGYDDVVVGASANDAGGANAGRAYLYRGGPSPDSVADFVLTGAAAGDVFGVSVASAGDVNGDGFDDLIVGASANDAGGGSAGRAYLFHGGPGLDAVADRVFTGAAAGDFLGFSVASAGDVNGDGFADVVVGAPFNDAGGTSAGRAYVHYGGPGADSVADLVFTGVLGDFFGGSVASAGDVDHDGYGDLLVGADLSSAGGTDAGQAHVIAVYPYRVLTPNGGEQWVAGRPATVRWLGREVADVAVSFDGGATWVLRVPGVGGGDENEVTFTAPGQATALAVVRVSASGQEVTRATSDESDGVFRIVPPHVPPPAAHRLRLAPSGAAAYDSLGSSVAGAGDMNGDGYDDVIVGASRNDAGGADAGRAYVFHGGPAGDAVPDLTLTGAATFDEFGAAVAPAGDVNADGYDDVIVGSPRNDAGGADAGRAYVYFGGPSADAVPDLVLTGPVPGARFGTSVAPAGDVNGDGYGDLLVGAPGLAYLFHGGPGMDAVPEFVFLGQGIGDNFAVSVAAAGDVNGDGFGDLLVGAPRNDAGGADAGQAYVYHGGPGIDAGPDLFLTGEAAGDLFGTWVAPAGDVDGDGHDDVVVGAPANDAGGADAGRAYVYFGGPAADAIPDLVLTGTAAGDAFGCSVAAAGDVNRDGRPDIAVGAHAQDAGGADAGRIYVVHGGPGADAVPDLVLTGEAAFDGFGSAVAGAGDVDGDGFDDLIAGAAGNDAGGADAGRAYVYDCNRYVVLSPNDGEVWNVGSSRTITWLGAARADVWLSVNGGAGYDRIRRDVGGQASNTLELLVPHAPSRFARVRVTPADPAVAGLDESDSTFTIQSSVALLNLEAALVERGAELRWSTDPGPGPEGIAGYRLYRLGAGETGTGAQVGPDLILEGRFHDPAGAPGHVYRLAAVDGWHRELEVGRVALAPAAPLAAWPLPYRGGELHVTFGVSGAFGSEVGEAVVDLFDLSGRSVKTLARGPHRTGFGNLTWDGRDESGVAVPDGVYFLRSRSAGGTHQIKIVVLQDRR